MPGESLPTAAAKAVDIGRRLFGGTPLAARFHAEHSDVFRLDLERHQSAHVIKLAQQDDAAILREQQVLRHLLALGLEVPAVEFTQADLPDEARPFTVMPLVRGTSAAAIYSQDTRRGVLLFERLGRLLGRLAGVPLDAIPGTLTPTEAQALEQTAWADLFADFPDRRWRTADFERYFTGMRDRLAQPPTVFGHRGGGQLITDGASSFAVVGWGEAGAVWPYADLARCIHGVRSTNDVRGGQWLAALLRGFGSAQPLADGWIDTVEAWLMFLCLRELIILKRRRQDYSISRVLTMLRQTPDRRWMEGT